MGFSYLSSRSALAAFAIVISCLVFAGGADTMVTMQADIHLKSGQQGMCRGNSKLGGCSEAIGDSDAIIAMQNRVHLELGQVGPDEGADGQEETSTPMKAVEDHAESSSSGPQEEKAAGLVDAEEVMFLESKKVLSEEGESQVVANDADALPSSNAAVMKLWHVLTEDRSEVDDAADDALPSILKESKSDDALLSVRENRSSDNATVAAGLDTSAEEKAEVAGAVAHSAAASSSAVRENKTSNTTGTVENEGQSHSLSPNASGQGVMMQELAGLLHRTRSLSQIIRQMVAVKLQALNPVPAIVLVVLILMCTCLSLLSVGTSYKIPFLTSMPSTAEGSSLGEQRQAMMARWPPSFSDSPVSPTSGSILPPRGQYSGQIVHDYGHHLGHASGDISKPSSVLSLPMSSKVLDGITASKPTSQVSVGALSMSRPMSETTMTPFVMATPQDAPSRVKLTPPLPLSQIHKPGREEEEEVPADALPPPLCSTLVMPSCEARFGVPMFELAEVTKDGEGEVGIVGLSGSPLLRGVVRKIGNMRSLEIAMNDANSAPRATITPSMMELAGQAPRDTGAKSFEIRGLRGVFYGILEMRDRVDGGTCCVVKDGETVLIVDGNADKMYLGIKSGNGTRLASACCSSKPFGGIDHIEIVCKKGVDTVLVLAVVLAVLLLKM